MDTVVKLRHEHPKLHAGIISRSFFCWIAPLFSKTTIKISDLYKVLRTDDSENLGDVLGTHWNNELNRKNPKLLRALAKTFLWNYMFYGMFLFFQHVALRSVQPMLLSNIISYFSQNDSGAKLYINASMLVVITFLVVMIQHHCNYGQNSIGMRVRVACCSLIYRKTLKLNKRAMGQTAIGQIVNLLSNDVNRFDLVFVSLHYLWIMPFQALLITYLIWREVGVSTLTGVLSMVFLTLPLQSYLGKLTSTLREKVAQRTDYRITLMSEIISGIQVIKMYAWEEPFKIVVRLARLNEVGFLTWTSYLRGIFSSFMVFVERVTLFLTITSYVLLGNVILAEQVFSLAQYFNLLQLTMSIFYPMSITNGAESLVSIDRIQTFLLLEENEESVVERTIFHGVQLKNVVASWTQEKPVLRNLNINIPPGSLCAIIGPVGSGKSSILQLLLGELRPQKGGIKVEGDISYACQEPWLFPSTVRNNILFGKKYEKRLYNMVVKVCALQKDFDQFPQGDKSLVGERGASLSGGQRARINLARAVYRSADVYLLDDPLSAVDTHVGRHLFDECILRFLRGKTRILVTHQLQYLKQADFIVLLNEGSIDAQGTFDELLNKDLNFMKLIVTSEESKEKEQESYSESYSSSALNEEGKNNEEVTGDTIERPLWEYIKAGGNRCNIASLFIAMILGQAACSGADYWVTYWTQQEALKFNYTKIHTSYPLRDNKFLDRNFAIYVYAALILAAIGVTIMRSCWFFKLAMNASKNLHNKMFSSILEAPMRFFNTNASGRILNRFSKDMGAIDEILPRVLLETVQIMLVMFGILVMVFVSNYYMLIVTFVLGIFFVKLRYWFISSAKIVKHLEGVAKSPMFSHINSSLNGITTIRAFEAQRILQKEFDDHQNLHTSAWTLSIVCTAFFGLSIDLVCVAFIGCTTFSFIVLSHFGQVNGSLVGLAISQSLILTGMLQYGIRQNAEVANQLTSVQRVLQYTDLEKEGPFEMPCDDIIPKPWPSNGLIIFENLFLRYSLDEAPVLKDLNLIIRPAEKVGIVGRTGAGKSSLISALFRLGYNEGHIYIDGVDIKYLGLHELRRNISIIPQEPVLFTATLRYNLDPFKEFTDANIWNVLEEVELKNSVDSLDMKVTGGGGNFSVGQRQLLCLARAILRNNKILILDEATANIDPETDALIQDTIRRKFEDCTVLTIAHRLNTIMDSDKVIVMESGKIVEYDYPYKLLQKTNSTFYKMVLETGPTMSEHLEDVALDAYLHKRVQEEK